VNVSYILNADDIEKVLLVEEKNLSGIEEENIYIGTKYAMLVNS